VKRVRECVCGEALEKGTRKIIVRRKTMMKLLPYRMASVVGTIVDADGDTNSRRC
jgi:hypothetical protein